MGFRFDELKEHATNIKIEFNKYKNLNNQENNIVTYLNQEYNFFRFPNQEYNEIETYVNNINKFTKNKTKDLTIFKECEKLSESINVFKSKIIESSFGNIIFSVIKDNIKELTDKIDAVNVVTHNKIDYFPENPIDEFNYNQNNAKKDLPKLFYPDLDKKNNNIEIEGIGGNNYSEISKNFSEFGDEIYNEIKEKFEKIKSKFIYKKYYANLLVKEEDFNKEKLNDIEKYLPEECKEFLLDFKTLRDEFLIKQCNISKDKLDFRYNFIIPNINLEFRKGGEIYNSPDGWFGFGLKMESIYENDILNKKELLKHNKAIAYYSFNNMTPRKIIMELTSILSNGLTQNNDHQPKCRCIDIRTRTNMKVGTGIYLSPKIDFIESNTGMIYFNGKAYKIALMVSVSADKIRQPDSNYWILRKEEIVLNKIIFKEIHMEKLDIFLKKH